MMTPLFLPAAAAAALAAAALPAADAAGHLRGLQMMCTMDWTPVCGADGEVYSNACTAENNEAAPWIAIENPAKDLTAGSRCDYEALSSASASEEPPIVVCTEEWAPVCGSDGLVYSNKCYAGAAGAESSTKIEDPADDLAPGSRCDYDAPSTSEEPGMIICPTIWAPVCGSDGMVYSSDCDAGAAGVESSTKIENPAKDLTAGSKCDYEAPSSTSEEPGMIMCPAIWAPVCGSDGMVYSSDCDAGAEGVESSTKIENPAEDLTAGSKCDYEAPSSTSEEPGMIICPAIWAPVCGSDGMVYSSDCDAGAAGVESSTKIEDPAEDLTAGSKCDYQVPTATSEEPGMIMCPAIWAPVCGSDGMVYSSDCDARAAGVESSTKIDNPAEDLTAGSKCVYEAAPSESVPPEDVVPCPAIWAPVCGADGMVYSSDCDAGAAGVDVSYAIEDPADDLTAGTKCDLPQQGTQAESTGEDPKESAQTDAETDAKTDAETDAKTPNPDIETLDDEEDDEPLDSGSLVLGTSVPALFAVALAVFV